MTSTPAEPGGAPRQIAYLVDDVAAAAAQFATRHGAGPFYVRSHIPLVEASLFGAPGEFDHSSAYGQWGTVMVELVQIHGPERERLRCPGALHHLAVFVDDLDAALAGRNDVALLASTGRQRFAFLDARRELGHFWELYEPTESLVGFYEFIRQASLDWNGDAPVRTL